MINKLINLIPIKTNNIENFIEKIKKYDCKQIDVTPDFNSVYDLFVTQTTAWIDYIAKTSSGRSIRFRLKPVNSASSPVALITGSVTEMPCQPYQKKSELYLSLIKNEIPDIQVNYDNSRLEKKLKHFTPEASLSH